MIRRLWMIPMLGLLTPQVGQAASNIEDAVEQHPTQPAPLPDASINKQILQTLTDIRDSQLSVLQAQVEILSILRSQEKAQPSAQRDETPAPVHRSGRKDHKRKPDTSLSAAR